MKTVRALGWPLWVLVAVYVVVWAADLLAPYDFARQHRAFPLAPPTRPHLFDPETGFHLRPFVYGLAEDPERLGEYALDRSVRYAVRFFVDGRLLGVDDGGHLFLLGTDTLGRDLFSRLLYGARLSLSAGLLAGIATIVLGLFLGAAAGYHGGIVDALVTRTAELVMTLPWIYLLLAARAFLPLSLTAGEAFLLIVAAITLVGWVKTARLARGVVMSVKERDYVTAARGFGASELYLLGRHVLPKTAGLALTQVSLRIPRFILAEVTLSFLGLGAPEPVPSLGSLLAALGQYHLVVAAWWTSLPALVLVGVVLSYHQLASRLEGLLNGS